MFTAYTQSFRFNVCTFFHISATLEHNIVKKILILTSFWNRNSTWYTLIDRMWYSVTKTLRIPGCRLLKLDRTSESDDIKITDIIARPKRVLLRTLREDIRIPLDSGYDPLLTDRLETLKLYENVYYFKRSRIFFYAVF